MWAAAPGRLVACGLLLAAFGAAGGQRRAGEGAIRRRSHRVQHGRCSYTFVLPEADPPPCPHAAEPFGANTLQRDSPAGPALRGDERPALRVQHLERALENNTQWLLKLESYIQMNMKSEMVHIQHNAVQNQTATMLEIGTNLLNQTAEQTRKLTDVEAQVLNQTSRIEIQLLENSLSTNKLEKQLLVQTNEIHKLQNQNSILETRVLQMEAKHLMEMEGIRLEKEELQQLVSRQSDTIQGLEKSLHATNSNTSLIHQQQLQLLESVQSLVQLVSQGKVPRKKEDRLFSDCAEILQSGLNPSGVYTLHINNLTESKKAYCDMEVDGGGWTVIQNRVNGSVSFQKNWKEYKQGFGDPAGEYWLGNEAVHFLTSQAAYSLRVELLDWEGHRVYAQYEKFQLGSESQRYRLFWKGYKGTAGEQSGLARQGTGFSTRDADNDNCLCKCAQMLSGGWWFDACGQSNLNGIYYPAKHNIRKLNGIRWHYFQGPGYSLKGTRMMLRPSSGREGA
ncbi:angiopoietin-4 [Varanus komodoensis]|uniref:Angiopoietin 4 n=1 Tax=Varanus komodoensis TaxID=61221 RepID=A0A8D2L5J7_VARKO|nr:angiopoietin-4 [Varanus komodoensis]